MFTFQMNNLYQWAYSGGFQFVTKAEPFSEAIEEILNKISIIDTPKLIGVWKFKTIKKQ